MHSSYRSLSGFLGWALLALLAAAPGWAQTSEVLVAPEPEWVLSCAWSFPANPSTDSKSQGVKYLVFERQENTLVAQDFTRTVMLMQNATGVQDCGSLTFRFDPSYQKLLLHKVQIHRGGETLDRLDQAKIRVIQPERGLGSHILTGHKTAVVLVEDLRVGDALEYSFTLSGRNTVLGNHYTKSLLAQGSMPVQWQRFRLVWPSAKALVHRQTPGLAEPRIERRGEVIEYLWDFENLAGVPFEDGVPVEEEIYPVIEFSDFHDWASVVRWALPLYRIPDGELPAKLRQLISEWSQEPAPEPRARRAVQFLQDEVRYTGLESGLGSHHPAPPAETFERRFGDCKAKVFLLCTILRQMNIPAWPALVSSASGGGVARCLPSPFAFDHVIVKMQLDGTNAWVDPTQSHQGGDLWHRALSRFGQALVVAEDTSDLEPVPYLAEPSSLEVTSVFTFVNYTNPAKLYIKSEYSGWKADNIREFFARTDSEEVAKNYLNYYSRFHSGIQKTAAIEVKDDLLRNLLVVEEAYEVPGFWKLDPKTHRYTAEFYADSLQNFLPDPGTRVRSLPLHIPFPVFQRHHVIAHMPDSNWDIPAETNSVENEAFAFTHERRATPSRVEFIYECRTRQRMISPDATPRYLQHLSQMKDLLGDTLYYTDPRLSSVMRRINWLMVVIAGFGMVGAGVGVLGFWRAMPPPVQHEIPVVGEQARLTGLGGWLFLVGIGLCVRPFLAVWTILGDWEGFFSLEVWQNVALPSGSSYHALYAPLLIFELLGNVVVLGLSVLALMLYFSRRRAFPKVFIIMLIFGAVFTLTDELAGQHLPQTKAAGLNSRAVSQAIWGALIWSLYALKSRRVQFTFVR